MARLYSSVNFSWIVRCVMLLPTYLDLSTHGEKFSSFTEWFTENSWFIDLFAKTLLVLMTQQNLAQFL